MRARWAVLAAVLVAAGLACSLNPQPYPPGQPDGSVGSFDAGASDGANAFGEGGAGEDTGAPPTADASTDASSGADAADAESDAPDADTDAADAADASDAETDATGDATGD